MKHIEELSKIVEQIGVPEDRQGEAILVVVSAYAAARMDPEQIEFDRSRTPEKEALEAWCVAARNFEHAFKNLEEVSPHWVSIVGGELQRHDLWHVDLRLPQARKALENRLDSLAPSRGHRRAWVEANAACEALKIVRHFELSESLTRSAPFHTLTKFLADRPGADLQKHCAKALEASREPMEE